MDVKGKIISGGWSHTAFCFLTTLSVAMMISYFTGPVLHDSRIIFPVLVLTVPFSFLHFGRIVKDVSNIFVSTLSLEIFLYLIYLVLANFALFVSSAGFMLAASATGLFFLVMTEVGYSLPAKRKDIFFHSGQTFLTCLLIASFFSGMKLPFLFIAIIKLISGIYNIYTDRTRTVYFSLRILRIALLMAAGISLITGISYSDPVITFIFLSGELLDRILFSYDLDIAQLKPEK